MFLGSGDIPSRIRAYCEKSDQPVPQTHAEIVRGIFDSMVMKYRVVFEWLSRFAAVPMEGIHV